MTNSLNPFYALLPQASDPSDVDHYKWGTVQPNGLILLDTDTSPLSDAPATLTPYVVGDRVFVLIHQRRAIVLGKAYTVDIDAIATESTPVTSQDGITTTTTSAGTVTVETTDPPPSVTDIDDDAPTVNDSGTSQTGTN